MPSERLAAARERKRLVLEWREAVKVIPRFPDEVAELGRPGPSLGVGEEGEIHYFTVRDALDALVFRVRWSDGGLWLERSLHGDWVDDPSLLAYFVGKESGASEIGSSEAEALRRQH